MVWSPYGKNRGSQKHFSFFIIVDILRFVFFDNDFAAN